MPNPGIAALRLLGRHIADVEPRARLPSDSCVLDAVPSQDRRICDLLFASIVQCLERNHRIGDYLFDEVDRGSE